VGDVKVEETKNSLISSQNGGEDERKMAKKKGMQKRGEQGRAGRQIFLEDRFVRFL